jgi:hypothetical protein
LSQSLRPCLNTLSVIGYEKCGLDLGERSLGDNELKATLLGAGAGKLTVIAATTHGLTLGRWRWGEDSKGPAGRPRVTGGADEVRHEANAYGVDRDPESGPTVHGIRNLPDARSWPEGSKLVQWVRLDPKDLPRNLVLLAKADGRWVHAASWGKFDAAPLRGDRKLAYWFLQSFYRHAPGFLGWDDSKVDLARGYVPAATVDLGGLPAAGEWVKLEVPLAKVGAAGKLLDGVASCTRAARWPGGGRPWSGRTAPRRWSGATRSACRPSSCGR